jgi:hypothetical protein
MAITQAPSWDGAVEHERGIVVWTGNGKPSPRLEGDRLCGRTGVRDEGRARRVTSRTSWLGEVSLRLIDVRRSRKPKYRLALTWVGSSGSEARMMEQNLGFGKRAPPHHLDVAKSDEPVTWRVQAKRTGPMVIEAPLTWSLLHSQRGHHPVGRLGTSAVDDSERL